MKIFKSKTGKILKAVNETQERAFKHAGYAEVIEKKETTIEPISFTDVINEEMNLAQKAAAILGKLGSKPNLDMLKAAAAALNIETTENVTKKEIIEAIEKLTAAE